MFRRITNPAELGGREYEIGSVTVNFVAGGDYNTALKKAESNYGENLLMHAEKKKLIKYIKVLQVVK
jgi:hypothetical protein